MLKVDMFRRETEKQATVVVSGESAEVDELLKRLALGTLLSTTMVASVTALAPAKTTPAEAIAASAEKSLPNAIATVRRERAEAMAKPAPKPAKKAEPEEGGDDAADADDAIPEMAMSAVKVRQVIDALVADGIAKDQASVVAWCVKHQPQVPVLTRLEDNMVDRITRAAGLVFEA